MWRIIVPFCIGITLVSITCTVILFISKENKNDEAKLQQQYPLLASRILINTPNDTLINFLPLRKSLRDYVTPFGDKFAFYFEYLPTGTSIGVNEKEEFNAASLIKVPGVMAYYRQLENNGFSLDNQTVVIKEKHIDKGFGSLWMKGAGSTITLEEAARLSLVESDNTASYVLADNVSQDSFNEVYEGLDIDLTKQDGHIIISAKSYTSILKALYFSAVLSKEHSQKILSYLSETTFDDKLVAGVEKGIVVSHKIGIYGDSLYQDCGIVYLPKRPYALCMISNTSDDVTKERMSQVSRMVYAYVKNVNK
jgi:beta-lactamase class A